MDFAEKMTDDVRECIPRDIQNQKEKMLIESEDEHVI